ncbi:putative sugar phosphate/phosphate translocator [Senna tora]|uniref:Putative sugar phosphate/phosphate translocator n=1 Tax=Senna tora TaxID=362788 RepID=A0A834TTM6_9FABA|nr:putative sugar phosphate/phosphate translocator [Senna tora]
MVEAQTWTTRRMSNPRLQDTTASDQVLDIPATPPGDVRNNNAYSLGSHHLPPNVCTALIIASWYFSNIGVLLLNKYLLSFYGYRYPIFLTMLHMLSCAAYSYVAINFLELVPLQHIHSRKQFFKIFALSAIFCFSVVCGNTSLRYLPVSFNQAIGATTPFFTAIFAFLITCKKESGGVYLALLPVVFGIVLASNKGNVASITIEKARGDPFIVFLLVGNATVAYLVNLTNFLVTKHTSALTLQVLGNAKAAVAAVVSVLIFRNPVTVMGMTGFAVTIMGVVLYSEAKKRSKVTAH